jgi:uncharacterized protein (UPF0335 family)
MEAIITAIIGGACVAVPSIIATLVGNSKTIYRIEQLEKKQDKHNTLIERTYKLEEDVKNIQDDIKDLRHS